MPVLKLRQGQLLPLLSLRHLLKVPNWLLASQLIAQQKARRVATHPLTHMVVKVCPMALQGFPIAFRLVWGIA